MHRRHDVGKREQKFKGVEKSIIQWTRFVEGGEKSKGKTEASNTYDINEDLLLLLKDIIIASRFALAAPYDSVRGW